MYATGRRIILEIRQEQSGSRNATLWSEGAVKVFQIVYISQIAQKAFNNIRQKDLFELG